MILRDIPALIAFIDSRQNVPHSWGRQANDCVGFCLAAAEAQTGVRIAPDVSWSGRAGALRVLRQFGSLEAAFDAYFERIAPAFARRGDIAGVPPRLMLELTDEEAELLGIHPMIVEGDLLVSPGDRGNRRGKRSAMTCAWSTDRPRQ